MHAAHPCDPFDKYLTCVLPHALSLLAPQEQAVCMLRNLVMDSDQHIRAVLDWAGADLIACLEEKLDPSRCEPYAPATSTAPAHIPAAAVAPAPFSSSPSSSSSAPHLSCATAATVHALYTVANLLTGSEAHKDAVMASNLPALLVHYLRPPSPGAHPHTAELRVAAIW